MEEPLNSSQPVVFATVHSSSGDITIDSNGFVIDYTDTTCGFIKASELECIRAITRFNLIECQQYYGELNTNFDILDLGYWYRDPVGDNLCGCYEPPEYDFRKTIEKEMEKGIGNKLV